MAAFFQMRRIARSYSGSCSYYAEHLDRHGYSVALSPNFPTYELAARWLDAPIPAEWSA